MYFDEAPKRDIDDFYNYRAELTELASGLKGGTRLTIVEGLRRTGKTSLILTALHNASFPSLVIDGRGFPESPAISKAEFVGAIQRSLNEFLKANEGWRKRILQAVKNVKGVEVELGATPILRLSWGGRDSEAVDLPAFFKALGDVAKEKDTHFAIVFDEAQEFNRLRGYDFPLLLSYVYDHISGVELVVSGSAIGLMYNFLRLSDTQAPLFGRAARTIKLNPLSENSSKEFLLKGFEQIRVKVSSELVERIVGALDGIIGWLTYCGAEAKFKGRMDDRILKTAINQGSRLAAEEFNHFIFLRQIARRRYIYLMSHLAEAPARWSQLKRALENDEGRPMNDKVFTTLLDSLVDGGFVVKGDEEYSISDPLLRHAFHSGIIIP